MCGILFAEGDEELMDGVRCQREVSERGVREGARALHGKTFGVREGCQRRATYLAGLVILQERGEGGREGRGKLRRALEHVGGLSGRPALFQRTVPRAPMSGLPRVLLSFPRRVVAERGGEIRLLVQLSRQRKGGVGVSESLKEEEKRNKKKKRRDAPTFSGHTCIPCEEWKRFSSLRAPPLLSHISGRTSLRSSEEKQYPPPFPSCHFCSMRMVSGASPFAHPSSFSLPAAPADTFNARRAILSMINFTPAGLCAGTVLPRTIQLTPTCAVDIAFFCSRQLCHALTMNAVSETDETDTP